MQVHEGLVRPEDSILIYFYFPDDRHNKLLQLLLILKVSGSPVERFPEVGFDL